MVKVTPAPIVIGPALIEFLVVLVEKLELIVLLFSYIQPLATVCLLYTSDAADE